jgi:hypothetical protein
MLSVNPLAQNSQNSRNQSAVKKHTVVDNFLLYQVQTPSLHFALNNSHTTLMYCALCTDKPNPFSHQVAFESYPTLNSKAQIRHH